MYLFCFLTVFPSFFSLFLAIPLLFPFIFLFVIFLPTPFPLWAFVFVNPFYLTFSRKLFNSRHLDFSQFASSSRHLNFPFLSHLYHPSSLIPLSSKPSAIGLMRPNDLSTKVSPVEREAPSPTKTAA